MKQVITKMLALIIALTMSICMAACGGPRPGGEEPEDPDKENITIWVHYTQQGFFEQVEEGFEDANPDVNIRVVGQPESNLGTTLDATLGTSSRPDIFATYGGLVAATLFKSGHLLNLNDVISPIEDKLVGAAKSNKKDGNGQYYTAPLNGFASPVIYYNKTMFEQMKNSNTLNANQKAAIKEPETTKAAAVEQKNTAE